MILGGKNKGALMAEPEAVKTIESVQVITHNSELYEVRTFENGHLTQKSFRGESGWSNAERYANDLLTKKRHSPFGERFIL